MFSSLIQEPQGHRDLPEANKSDNPQLTALNLIQMGELHG